MTSTLRSAASGRTGVSGGARSGGQASGLARKTVPPPKPARTLPKLIENNQDVTPKPLIDPESYLTKVKDSFLTQDASSTPSEAAYSTAQPQVFSATKSMVGMSHGGGLNSHGTDAESFPSEHETDQMGHSVAIHAIEEDQSLMSMDGEVTQPLLTLTETETIFILSIDSSIVASDAKDLDSIKQSNERYVELCKSKQGSDIFSDRGMNTFNSAVKNKEIQCERLGSQSRDAYASTADMYDSVQEQTTTVNQTKRTHETQTVDDGLVQTSKSRSASSAVEKSHGTRLSDQSMDETMRKPSGHKSKVDEAKVPEPFDSSKIATSVFIMERVLNLNTNQSKQAIYRGLKPLVAKEEKGVTYTGLVLDKLFSYSADMTSNKNVSALAWNRKNHDLLAVGYGPFEYNDQRDGLVCCWSIKNQEFPERYFHTPAGVTTVAFSAKFPSLLAVGLFDGTVNVYDVQTNNDKPLLDTEEAAGKHTAPVWHLYWVEVEKGRDDDTGEVLMSISTDGRVTQWLLRKGFESNDYMKLKRILSKQTIQKRESGKDSRNKADNLLFRTSGGLCFDVCPDDTTIYLCGTEEGLIHRCSVSYNEQYLDTYSSHTGPVYRIAWSPIAKGVFLSSSADWTVSLWTVDRFQPCITFASRKKPVFDLCWSPKSATMFCCANEEAVEVWDLSKNILEPINVILATQQYIFTSISYAPNSESILAGTNTGSVMVYHLKNLPAPTSESDLLSLIEQQRHHLPPPDDIGSSAASAVTGKEDAPPLATKH